MSTITYNNLNNKLQQQQQSAPPLQQGFHQCPTCHGGYLGGNQSNILVVVNRRPSTSNRGPRPLTLGACWSQQLRNEENLPSTMNNIPANALPQQQQFVITTSNNNTTRSTTNNRYAVFANEQEASDTEEEDINNNNQINEQPLLFKNNKKKNNNKTKGHSYLSHNRVLTYFKNNDNVPKDFLELLQDNRTCDGKDYNHWAKEIIQRTKKCDDNENIRFVEKKINHLSFQILQARAAISKLQIQFSDYWTQISLRKKTTKHPNTRAQTTNETTTSSSTSTTTMPHMAFEIDQFEKLVADYIKDCIQHLKKICETRILLAKAQMERYKALEDFEQVSTTSQMNIHVILKPKMKICSIKNENFHIAQKSVQYNLPPKFITKTELSFKIDESMLKPTDIQTIYNDMRQITNELCRKSMELNCGVAAREFYTIKNEIDEIIENN
ncbi:unnamed protein product [Rotaria sordida]|uniref:Uncharacterized protein n=1 Tax=Rotaria sordida TaxID=392033 RepID=A0A815MPR6_9BILA|nr:unnamed protein product [Rotaria sordida]CAF1631669.1 unnamed protein product [Rotaria sordida]